SVPAGDSVPDGASVPASGPAGGSAGVCSVSSGGTPRISWPSLMLGVDLQWLRSLGCVGVVGPSVDLWLVDLLRSEEGRVGERCAEVCFCDLAVPAGASVPDGASVPASGPAGGSAGVCSVSSGGTPRISWPSLMLGVDLQWLRSLGCVGVLGPSVDLELGDLL